MVERVTAERRRRLEGLASQLGVRFRHIGWLHQALTHTSYANESRIRVEHNERLEFLGDAVLELAISTYLFKHFPELPEGDLTKSRAAVVCEASLSSRAAELNLGDYLLLGHGEQSSGGRKRASILEDAFEAVIGAIYMDQGWACAQAYVIRQLEEHLEQVENGVSTVKDYKTMLQELVQRHGENKISYCMIGSDGPDHAKVFKFEVRLNDEVLGIGTGPSKKAAEQRAAKQALEKMNK
ncbi:MAG: ribonuclease III [Anaerovibrio sp.]|uniref:ribonuclease III n=1 Tax=Anaerovibrio sp. TaxID=1872532 RepID=UPI001B2CB2D2|nr:ribonuclease III [Anaerovibrio sp.]MBO6246314.1 ribonuclease III [Anaerovibrio sp.]